MKPPPDKPVLKVVDDDSSSLETKAPKQSAQLSWLTGQAAQKEGEQEVVRLESEKEFRSSGPEIDQLLEAQPIELEDVEQLWGGSSWVIPKGWVVLAGLALCCFLVWAVLDLFHSRKEIDALLIEKKTLMASQGDEDAGGRESLEAMQNCVRAYLAAGSVEAMLPYVRHSERVGPLMATYYKTHKRWRRHFRRFEHLRAVSIGSKSFVYVMAETPGDEFINLLLEQGEDGIYRVDWESHVMHQEWPWSEYVRTRPVKPVNMRVMVEPDDFYGFAFRDSERYRCYKLTVKGSNDYLYGYVERGSEQERRIESLLRRLAGKRETGRADEAAEDKGIDSGVASRELTEAVDRVDLDDPIVLSERVLSGRDNLQIKPEPMILRIRFLPEDPSMRAVKIESLVEERWIYINSPKPDS